MFQLELDEGQPLKTKWRAERLWIQNRKVERDSRSQEEKKEGKQMSSLSLLASKEAPQRKVARRKKGVRAPALQSSISSFNNFEHLARTRSRHLGDNQDL